MKYLASKFIEIATAKQFQLCQKDFILKMLKRFNMEDCNGSPTPCVIQLPEPPNKNIQPDKSIPYEALVGSLFWLSLGTRADIAFSVHNLSKYTKCYNAEMWSFGKRILRYLKQTMNDSLIFNSQIDSDRIMTNSSLIGFCDAVLRMTRQTEINLWLLSLFNGNCVSWTSRKMESVALSTCEAEFIAMTKLLQELFFFKQLINEILENSITSMIIHSDNKSAITLAIHSVDHGRSKHIDIKLHFIREHVKNNALQLQYLNSENQTADIFTKPLSREKFNKHKSKLNIIEF